MVMDHPFELCTHCHQTTLGLHSLLPQLLAPIETIEVDIEHLLLEGDTKPLHDLEDLLTRIQVPLDLIDTVHEHTLLQILHLLDIPRYVSWLQR